MTESPFRAMDEFDVFMVLCPSENPVFTRITLGWAYWNKHFWKTQDAVSRKISLDALVDFAIGQGSQWMFITPHDIRSETTVQFQHHGSLCLSSGIFRWNRLSLSLSCALLQHGEVAWEDKEATNGCSSFLKTTEPFLVCNISSIKVHTPLCLHFSLKLCVCIIISSHLCVNTFSFPTHQGILGFEPILQHLFSWFYWDSSLHIYFLDNNELLGSLRRALCHPLLYWAFIGTEWDPFFLSYSFCDNFLLSKFDF